MGKVLSAMLGASDLSEFGEKEVDDFNQAKRLPAIILVDTSGSMKRYEDLLKQAVASLYDEILRDGTARSATELAVMTFNSDIEILERMKEIELQESKGRNLDFHCEGVTLTGLATKAAIKHLEARIATYKQSAPIVPYYPPILFVLSDGYPFCGANCPDEVRRQEEMAMRESKQYIRAEVAANRLVVVSVEVGDGCDHELMRELTGLDDDRHVFKVNDSTELANFFRFTSSILISSSKNGTKSLNDMSLVEMFQ